MHVLLLPGDSLVARGLRQALSGCGNAALITVVAQPEDVAGHLTPRPDEVLVVHLAALPDALALLGGSLRELAPPRGLLGVAPESMPAATLLDWVRPGRGFVFETCLPGMLCLALETVAAGGSFGEPTMGAALVAAERDRSGLLALISQAGLADALGPTHLQVLLLALMGWTDQASARTLFLSDDTVGHYLHEACERCHIADGRMGILRHLYGKPPCGGNPQKCPHPARRGESMVLGKLPSCPGWHFCVRRH